MQRGSELMSRVQVISKGHAMSVVCAAACSPVDVCGSGSLRGLCLGHAVAGAMFMICAIPRNCVAALDPCSMDCEEQGACFVVISMIADAQLRGRDLEGFL